MNIVDCINTNTKEFKIAYDRLGDVDKAYESVNLCKNNLNVFFGFEEVLELYKYSLKVVQNITLPLSIESTTPVGDFSNKSSKGLIMQDKAAEILAKNGYKIEMLYEVAGGNGYGIKENSNPDFIIEGKVFDCYSPIAQNPSLNTISTTLSKKCSEQANRIILNLELVSDEYISKIKDEILKKINYKLHKLEELKVIVKNEDEYSIYTWYVR